VSQCAAQLEPGVASCRNCGKMSDPRTCTNCGAVLAGGAPSCGACGKLDTVESSGTATFLFACLGVFVGLVLGGAYVVAISIGSDDCALAAVHNALAIAGIVADLAMFVFGVRLARVGKPRVGALLISAAVAFLLPATPCAISVLSLGRC